MKIAAQRQTRINSTFPSGASLSAGLGLGNGLSHDLELNSYMAKIGYYRALSRVLYFGYDGLGDFDDVDTGVSDTSGTTTGIKGTTGKSKKKNKTNGENSDKGVVPIVSHLVYALRDKFGLDRIGKIDLLRANDVPISSQHAKPFPSSSSSLPLFLGSSEKSSQNNTKSAYDSILKEEKKEVIITHGPLNTVRLCFVIYDIY